MKITIENATVTATVNGQRYVHGFVTNVAINDPRENALTISPQGGSIGIPFRTGTSSAITLDMVCRDWEVPLASLYKKAFGEQTRIDFMIVDTATGERYDFNDSIIRTNPLNGTISEGETSLDVSINASCPPSGFNHVAV